MEPAGLQLKMLACQEMVLGAKVEPRAVTLEGCRKDGTTEYLE